MGIYSNGTIFGIKIYTFADNDADFSTTLYEQVYDTIMSAEQKLESYVFYTELAQGFAESRERSKSAKSVGFGRDEVLYKNNQSDQLRFQVYTKCISTLEPNDTETFMSWWPISLEQFLKHFKH